MTDIERIEKILSELKVDFISYDSMHEDHGHGLRVIERALKHILIHYTDSEQCKEV